MNILLIAPTDLEPGKKVKFNLFPQASLPLLAGLTPQEHSVRIVDERLEDIDLTGDYDLVGITVMTGTAFRAYQIADQFRERGTRVVLGGIHPSILPEEAQIHADSVVIGEAEDLWKNVLSDTEAGTLHPVYRNESLPCLENMPAPRLDLLQGRYLFKHAFQTTRGCPHQCRFCSVSAFNGKKFRHRPVEDVIREIEQCRSRYIVFLDDNIVSNPRYAKELFQALTPLKKKWASQGTITMAEQPELLALAQKSGCIALFIGFESINESALTSIQKDFNPINRFKKLIENFHRHGIMAIGSFIIGFDEDDQSVVSSTLRFVEEARIDLPIFNILTPLPGTEIYRTLQEQGRIFDHDWSHYNLKKVVYHPARMTIEELEEGHWSLISNFYSKKSIMRRVLHHLKYIHYLLPLNFNFHGYAQECARRLKERHQNRSIDSRLSQ